MRTSIFALISICCSIFILNCGKADAEKSAGHKIVDKAIEFFKCAAEKSGDLEMKKQMETWSNDEAAKKQFAQKTEAMDKNCTAEEFVKINEKMQCFMATCRDPKNTLNNFEAIMTACNSDELYQNFSDSCSAALPFGGARPQN